MAAEKWRPRINKFPRPSDGVDGPDDDDGSWRVAARWWEPRRLAYNAILALTFAALLARTWNRIAPELTVPNILRLFVLGLLANLCYSAAYPADMAWQAVVAPSQGRPIWRWSIWTVGTLFAVLFETYWYFDEILPPILQ